MKVLKAYKYRLYPTSIQEEFIKKTFSCVRLVHNLLLQERIQLYKQLKENPDLKVKLPTPAQYKKEYPCLKEVDSLALSNAQVYLDRAFKKFHREKSIGFPKLKQKKDSVSSYTTNNQNGTVKIIDEKYLKVPKLKSLVKMKMHRPVIGKIKSVTISLTPSNKYFASILCEEEIPTIEKTYSAVGITLGASEFAVLSNGRRIDNDKFTKEFEQRITREERKLTRRKEIAKAKGTDLSQQKNYQKQKLKVAKMREKLMNQRIDFLNKITTEIVRKYDLICIEDIHQADFYRNSKLHRGISDVSWALFVSKLEYKATWYNKRVIKVLACGKCSEHSENRVSQIFTQDINEQKGLQDPETAASINVLIQGLKKTTGN
ncbi:IS605 OrfB family transposase [Enterococcus sp. 7E2_DIV0204]|uniref:IS605 OrfB family transposase n=1 Tax=Candidatus Enterococcus lemimoniae TaxID=1834167 RepID=A0ABZ2T8R6_9ENTE|nr:MULTISPECIES: RNA-guided endonuclease TnpB family protein [unclassified Enterococcus]OTN88174.1 IS605 OrfB family transposase [Enterococcus sp. 7E2_DIV0204]OTO70346.1 IS605 OrfB family transposase [Enterococcus sp. 12C11_DIV0727]OTP49147.1 IS605 OrfB family transposase [Enterococcus sp. 7D2_DIV0200]